MSTLAAPLVGAVLALGVGYAGAFGALLRVRRLGRREDSVTRAQVMQQQQQRPREERKDEQPQQLSQSGDGEATASASADDGSGSGSLRRRGSSAAVVVPSYASVALAATWRSEHRRLALVIAPLMYALVAFGPIATIAMAVAPDAITATTMFVFLIVSAVVGLLAAVLLAAMRRHSPASVRRGLPPLLVFFFVAVLLVMSLLAYLSHVFSFLCILFSLLFAVPGIFAYWYAAQLFVPFVVRAAYVLRGYDVFTFEVREGKRAAVALSKAMSVLRLVVFIASVLGGLNHIIGMISGRVVGIVDATLLGGVTGARLLGGAFVLRVLPLLWLVLQPAMMVEAMLSQEAVTQLAVMPYDDIITRHSSLQRVFGSFPSPPKVVTNAFVFSFMPLIYTVCVGALEVLRQGLTASGGFTASSFTLLTNVGMDNVSFTLRYAEAFVLLGALIWRVVRRHTVTAWIRYARMSIALHTDMVGTLFTLYEMLHRGLAASVVRRLNALAMTGQTRTGILEFVQGLVYLQKEAFTESIECLNYTIHIEPRCGDAYFMKALGLAALDHSDEALDMLTIAQQYHVHARDQVLFERGSLLALQDGRMAEAIAAFTRALKYNSRNAKAWTRLAELALRTGRQAEAQRAAQKAVNVDPLDMDARLLQCRVAGRLRQSELYYGLVRELSTIKDPVVLELLADVRIEIEGDYNQAITLYRGAMQLLRHPTRRLAYKLARALVQKRQLVAARHLLELFVDQRRLSPQSEVEMLWLLAECYPPSEAPTALHRLRRVRDLIGEYDTDLFMRLGERSFQSGLLAESRAYFKQVLDSGENIADSSAWLGLCSVLNGEGAEQFDSYFESSVTTVFDGAHLSWWLFARFLCDAITKEWLFDLASMLRARGVAAHLVAGHLARTFFVLGHFDYAANYYAVSLAHEPDADFCFEYARVMVEQGQVQQARDLFKQCLKFDKVKLESLFNIAYLWNIQGNKTQAEAALVPIREEYGRELTVADLDDLFLPHNSAFDELSAFLVHVQKMRDYFVENSTLNRRASRVGLRRATSRATNSSDNFDDDDDDDATMADAESLMADSVAGEARPRRLQRLKSEALVDGVGLHRISSAGLFGRRSGSGTGDSPVKGTADSMDDVMNEFRSVVRRKSSVAVAGRGRPAGSLDTPPASPATAAASNAAVDEPASNTPVQHTSGVESVVPTPGYQDALDQTVVRPRAPRRRPTDVKPLDAVVPPASTSPTGERRVLFEEKPKTPAKPNATGAANSPAAAGDGAATGAVIGPARPAPKLGASSALANLIAARGRTLSSAALTPVERLAPLTPIEGASEPTHTGPAYSLTDLVVNKWGQKIPRPPKFFDAVASKAAKTPLQRKNTKQFFWKAIPSSALKDTFWGERTNAQDLDLNMDELGELFSARPAGTPAAAPAAAPRLRSLLELRRANNVGIVISRIKGSFPSGEPQVWGDICRAIRELDDTRISDQHLGNLMRILPSQEESMAVQRFRGDINELTSADIFFHEVGVALGRGGQACLVPAVAHPSRTQLIQVPKYALRIHSFRLWWQFADRIGAIDSATQRLNDGCVQVRQSTRLTGVLQVVLRLGNQLNNASQQAEGFRLESLLLMVDTKSTTSRKTTLLSYLIDVLRRKRPNLVTFYEDLPGALDASHVSIDTVQGDIKTLRNDVETMVEFYEQLEPRDPARAKLDSFPAECQTSVAAAFTNLEVALDNYSQVIKYFGESSDLKPHDFFGQLHKFISLYKEALAQAPA